MIAVRQTAVELAERISPSAAVVRDHAAVVQVAQQTVYSISIHGKALADRLCYVGIPSSSSIKAAGF